MIADSLKKEPVAFALTSIGHVAGWLFPSKQEGERTVKALLDENERLRKGIQDYLDGDYEPRVKKIDKCQHGMYGYEACEGCIAEHFQRVLSDKSKADHQ